MCVSCMITTRNGSDFKISNREKPVVAIEKKLVKQNKNNREYKYRTAEYKYRYR